MLESGKCPSCRTRMLVLTVLASYCVFIVLLWAWYGFRSGMPFETVLVYWSQERQILRAFFQAGEPLRIHTPFFYHLSYLLAKIIGLEGSFVTYQIVYAALWLGRGALAFLIWKRLVPQSPILAYIVGALVIFHAPDTALNWVGLLNHFGFMFWMMLSFGVLVSGFQRTKPLQAALFGLTAASAAYMSLWTYESPVFVIMMFPALVFLMFGHRSRRNAYIALVYWAVPIYYTYAAAGRYLAAGRDTYQIRVLRTDWAWSSMASDALFHLASAVSFWNWGSAVREMALASGFPDVPTVVSATLPASAVATFIMFGLVIGHLSRGTAELLPSDGVLARVLLSGIIFLVLSFPAYLILDRTLWRTQFLSGFGTAVILSAVAGLGGKRAPSRTLQLGVVLLMVAGVVVFGTAASLNAGNFHYGVWERHRVAMAQILEVAPRVSQDTVIVLMNVRKGADPFGGHNMWFDVALMLAYPHTRVAGIYFYEDGSRPPGHSMVVRSGAWQSTPEAWPTVVRTADFASTVVIELDTAGHARLVEIVPERLDIDAGTARHYDPRRTIQVGPPSTVAIRRYGPIGMHRDRVPGGGVK